MRDPRITVFTSAPVTVSSATTTNGATIDLKDNYTGNYFEGAPEGYGVGVEVMFYDVTGTNNNIVLKWQVSADNGTWIDDQRVAAGELSALIGSGTKFIVPTRLETAFRYIRLCVVSTGMGTSSFKVNAWVSDGTTNLGYGQPHARV